MTRSASPFRITTIKPELPEEVSNKDRMPLTVHVGRGQKAKTKKPVKKASPDRQANKKKAAADAVRARLNAAKTKPADVVHQKPEPKKAVQPKVKAAMKTPVKPAATQPVTPVPAQAAPAPQVAKVSAKSQHEHTSVFMRYAAHLGQRANAQDVSEILSRYETAKIGPYELSATLEAMGLVPSESTLKELNPTAWPALALMSTGHVVLVLEQGDGHLTLFQQDSSEQTTRVPLSEFAPYFSGTIVQAQKSIENLSNDHAPINEGKHWFWGQFGHFKKQMGEIALGSLVANMLAVAVALFSLQVYDRVIPHQSTATLWVLALGVMLAIVLEGMLKFARARLMDGTGRSIELKVQSLLMQRLLGMKSDHKGAPPTAQFSAMREFGSVREFFTSSTIGSAVDIPFIFLFFALIASIAGPVVMIVMLGAVAMVLPGYFLQGRMMRLTKETHGEILRTKKACKLAHGLGVWCAAAYICACGCCWRVSCFHRRLYSRHNHRDGHSYLPHLGAADAAIRDTRAVDEC